MKILYCIPNLEHGGAERQMSYIAAELARLGHEVHVASRASGPNLERILASGAVWHCLGKSDIRDYGKYGSRTSHLLAAADVLWRLIGLIRKIRPDIIQTVLAPMDVLGGTAALLTGAPWVLKECSAALVYTTYRRYWLRFAFGSLANGVIANSEHGKDYWRKAHTQDRLYVIPNAIPIAEIRQAQFRDNTLNLKSDDKVVLYAGRIDIGKNVEGLIGALALIQNDVSFKLIICGEGANRASVEQMARELGIADRVIFTGYVDNLWELMKRANAFVSLSRCEGCPNVVLEAMACECPLIVSDIPAHREMLNEKEALFVNLDDPEAAARAILSTLTDTAATQARAESAGANVNQRPSLEVAARKHEAAYREVIESRGALLRRFAKRPRPEWKFPAEQGEP